MNPKHIHRAAVSRTAVRLMATSALLFVLLSSVSAQTLHRLNGITLTSNRVAQLSLTGSVASAFLNFYDLYPLEASTNLADWNLLATLFRTNSSAAPLRYLDPEATGLDRRFYRTPTNHLITAFPKPTGPHAVGTVSRQLVDPARTNRLPIMIRICYPAHAQAGVLPAETMDQRIAADWAAWNGLPAALYQSNHAHAQTAVPIATNESAFPILIYSHGGAVVHTDNLHNMENLASHGFVVVAIQQAIGFATALPDGSVYFFQRPQPDLVTVRDEVQDAQFVIGELERMNLEDPLFAVRLDLDRIGAFGYSYGGGVTIELCASNSRCKAAAILDGALHSHLFGLGFNKPLMMLSGDSTELFLQAHRIRMRTFFDKFSLPGAYWIKITGAAHSYFNDYIWFSRPTDAARLRIVTVVRDYLLSFFKRHLRGEDDHLLDGSSPAYPEASPFLRSELTILTQPPNQNIRRGSNATFTVSATSALPISYQWRFNGAALLGATSSNLTFTSVQATNAGTYSLVLMDGVTTLTSREAVLNVGDAPVITTQPQSQTVHMGEDVTLSISANGTLPIGYRWRRNGSTFTNFLLYANTSLLTIANVQTNQAGSYTVAVTNLFGTTPLSSAAVLTVLSP